MSSVEDLAARAGASVRRLQPRLGAEISGVDFRRPIDGRIRDLLHAALLKYKVLFFRDQDITPAQHLAIGRVFGGLEVHPLNAGEDTYYNGGAREILAVRTRCIGLAEHTGEDDRSASNWHTDMTQRPRPPMLAILHGVQVPPLGGDTVWCDAVAAYAGLDAATKARIEHLKAEHDTREAQARYAKTPEELERIRQQNPPRAHPIVRIHPETGERILFVNAAVTKRIVGLSEDDSDRLLERLFEQFKKPEYHVRFHWEPHSIAIWDERSTQHYAVQGFEGIDERILHRVCVEGDEPFGPGDARAVPAAARVEAVATRVGSTA